LRDFNFPAKIHKVFGVEKKKKKQAEGTSIPIFARIATRKSPDCNLHIIIDTKAESEI
jgi:hypothetical protein